LSYSQDDKATQKRGSDGENHGTIVDRTRTKGLSAHRTDVLRACSIKIHQVTASYRAVRSRS